MQSAMALGGILKISDKLDMICQLTKTPKSNKELSLETRLTKGAIHKLSAEAHELGLLNRIEDSFVYSGLQYIADLPRTDRNKNSKKKTHAPSQLAIKLVPEVDESDEIEAKQSHPMFFMYIECLSEKFVDKVLTDLDEETKRNVRLKYNINRQEVNLILLYDEYKKQHPKMEKLTFNGRGLTDNKYRMLCLISKKEDDVDVDTEATI
jgi:hypothetical protein